MQTLQQQNLSNKRVLVRCDFNVPLHRGRVLDDFKIRRAIETINFLRQRNAKVILLSHLGRPRSRFLSRKAYSLKPVALVLEKLLGCPVQFSKKCFGLIAEKKVHNLKPGQILLLENVRFEKGELQGDLNFAGALAKLGDFFVNEAIAASHRSHASIAVLPNLLPHAAGLDFQQELSILNQLKKNQSRPFSVIIGGAKVEEKIKAVKRFLETADHVLLGGKIANVLLSVQGISMGRPCFDRDIFNLAKTISITNPRLHLPFDVVVSPFKDKNLYSRETGPAKVRPEEDIYDVGRETAEAFADIILESKAIFWTGLLGLAENDSYDDGSQKILSAIVQNSSALKVAGGGDTIAFIRKNGLESEFSFLLTGGSASLEFLADVPLPGLQALET